MRASHSVISSAWMKPLMAFRQSRKKTDSPAPSMILASKCQTTIPYTVLRIFHFQINNSNITNLDLFIFIFLFIYFFLGGGFRHRLGIHWRINGFFLNLSLWFMVEYFEKNLVVFKWAIDIEWFAGCSLKNGFRSHRRIVWWLSICLLDSFIPSNGAESFTCFQYPLKFSNVEMKGWTELRRRGASSQWTKRTSCCSTPSSRASSTPARKTTRWIFGRRLKPRNRRSPTLLRWTVPIDRHCLHALPLRSVFLCPPKSNNSKGIYDTIRPRERYTPPITLLLFFFFFFY